MEFFFYTQIDIEGSHIQNSKKHKNISETKTERGNMHQHPLVQNLKKKSKRNHKSFRATNSIFQFPSTSVSPNARHFRTRLCPNEIS